MPVASWSWRGVRRSSRPTFPSRCSSTRSTSYRPPQLGSRMRAALDRGQAEGRVTAVEIGPLLRSEAELLVSREMPPTLLDSLYKESGGNPFYLLELARAATAGVRPGRNAN